MPAPLRIVIAAFPDLELLDVAGPASVFANAARLAPERAPYQVLLAATRRGAVPSSSGVALEAALELADAPRAIHTLLVPGGEGTRAALADADYVAQVRRLARRATRVTSVCSGSFVLAEAGLLDGRRATTHWRHVGQLRDAYPKVQVEPDAIFVRDGRCWTSAGVTAGLDLALALVEADAGRDVALAVARMLVFYLKRPGGQSQFSAPLASQAADTPLLERVRRHVLEHPDGDLRLAALAERVHVSERHLRRLFARDLRLSPREFVQRTRLEHAQRLLCDTRASVRAVARRCGYGTPEAFARRFAVRFGVSPSAYRQRFRGDPTVAPT